MSRPRARAAIPGSCITPIRRRVSVVIGLAIRLPSSFRQVAVHMSSLPAHHEPGGDGVAEAGLGVPPRHHDAVSAQVHDPARAGPFSRDIGQRRHDGGVADVRAEPGVMVESVLGGGHQGVRVRRAGPARGRSRPCPRPSWPPRSTSAGRPGARRDGRTDRSPGRRAGRRCFPRRSRTSDSVGVRAHTVTEWPESDPAAARTVPMAPAPMTATCMVATVPGPSSEVSDAGTRAAGPGGRDRAGRPVEHGAGAQPARTTRASPWPPPPHRAATPMPPPRRPSS